MRDSWRVQAGVKGWAQVPDWTVQMWVQVKDQAVSQHIVKEFGDALGGWRGLWGCTNETRSADREC